LIENCNRSAISDPRLPKATFVIEMTGKERVEPTI